MPSGGDDDESVKSVKSTISTATERPSVQDESSSAFDGAGDSLFICRTSSLSDLKDAPLAQKRQRLVRFASQATLETCCSRPARRDSPASSRTEPHSRVHGTTFVNPFNQSDSPESRKTSDASSSNTSAYIRAHAFAGHRDTLARLERTWPMNEDEEDLDAVDISTGSGGTLSVNFSHGSTLASWQTFAQIHSEQRSNPYVPGVIIEHLLQLLSHHDFLNLRLTCRQWYRALPPPAMPGSYRVPREVLLLIFSFLDPCDFDAARHTCRKWFDAGLDIHFTQIDAPDGAQCQNAFKADLRRIRSCHEGDADGIDMSEEWLMSKRIATATKLSVDWRGLWSETSIGLGHTRFNTVEQVNFRRLLVGLTSSDSTGDGKTFSVSTCGRYLLVRSGSDIFVYALRDTSDSIIPVIRLVANRPVLRVSMDTSSGRYAVAALLDDRTGVLWDLNNDKDCGQPHFHTGEPMTLGMKTEVRGACVSDRTESLTGHLPLRRARYSSWRPLTGPEARRNRPGWLNFQAVDESMRPFLDEPESFCSSPESEEDQAGPSTGITIQTRPTAIYRNLGSPDDVPRSVAICPSRKCVAFGCRLGIELHWVDALTAGDLNRWFPLAAPSDHLYFLPQRQGVDSGKKLRLVSSAAGPSAPSTSRSETLPARLKQREKTHDRGRRQSMTRLFFGNLPLPLCCSLSTQLDKWRRTN